jgi:hypothetical protein
MNNNILLLCVFLLCGKHLMSQQFLQLETINDPETKKFSINTKFTYKSIHEEVWQSRIIDALLYKDSTVLFQDGMIKLNEIKAIQLKRPMADLTGKTMMGLGVTWLVYGSLDALRDNGEALGGSEIIISVTSIATGFLIRKLFYKRTVNMGSRYRLRLMDLRL